MSRAKRVDANQNAIVKQLRKMGFSVAITSMVGKGFPDLVVANWYMTVLVELKDPSKPPSARKLTEDEKKFHDSWCGDIVVATKLEDIIQLLENA